VDKARIVALVLAGSVAVATGYFMRSFSEPDSQVPASAPINWPIGRGAWRQISVAPETTAEATTLVITIPTEGKPRTTPQISYPVQRDRYQLAKQLQGELQRVGCYGGELNGIWTAATRQAMRAFTARVNARLPTEEPDEVLLSLVRGHDGKVCERECVSAHGRGNDDRCPSHAVSSRPGVSDSSWSTSTTVAPPLTPLAPGERPMALAGPAIGESLPIAAPPADLNGQNTAASTSGFGPGFFRRLDTLGNN
jgi:hypothetical protein